MNCAKVVEDWWKYKWFCSTGVVRESYVSRGEGEDEKRLSCSGLESISSSAEALRCTIRMISLRELL
nr:hypothetical protein CFP56_19490 [Quercus suber]